MRGLINKLLVAGIKGGSILGGAYLGFKEENWVLGGICIIGGFALGSLVEAYGYETYYEKRMNEFEEAYFKKSKELDEKQKQLEEMLTKLEDDK